jgi:hypothetical protein
MIGFLGLGLTAQTELNRKEQIKAGHSICACRMDFLGFSSFIIPIRLSTNVAAVPR